MVGLGKAGKNIVKLFKPHTKNYKIIIFDENDGLELKNSVEEYDEQSRFGRLSTTSQYNVYQRYTEHRHHRNHSKARHTYGE